MTAHVAVPDVPCGNGCHSGHGDTRTPVLCDAGAKVCARCIDRLDTWLRQIPDTYALLPLVVEHGTVSVNPEMATTKRPDPPAPLRLEVLDLLDDRPARGVLGLLVAWADLVRAERRLPAQLAASVTTESRLLLAHLAWAARQEWVTDLYAELKPVVRELLDRVGEYRPHPVGMCVALVRRTGFDVALLCGGPLYRDTTGHGVHCAACGDQTDPRRLLEIGRTVGLISDHGSRAQEANA